MQSRNDRSGVLQRSTVRRVWVDLTVAFLPPGRRGKSRSVSRSGRGRPDPHGVDLAVRAPGELLSWHRTTTGEWIGWGSVSVAVGGEVHQVWTYLPAGALSPRDDVPAAGTSPIRRRARGGS